MDYEIVGVSPEMYDSRGRLNRWVVGQYPDEDYLFLNHERGKPDGSWVRGPGNPQLLQQLLISLVVQADPGQLQAAWDSRDRFWFGEDLDPIGEGGPALSIDNPHARRRKLHPYGNAEASRRSLHPYGNPLTTDQHHEGWYRADMIRDAHTALEEAAARRGDDGALLSHAVHRGIARGAGNAHYHASNDRIWPGWKAQGEPTQGQYVSQFGHRHTDLDRAFGMRDMIEDNPTRGSSSAELRGDGKWHRFPWPGPTEGFVYGMRPRESASEQQDRARRGVPAPSAWIEPYKPRSEYHRSGRTLAALYEDQHGQKVPKGTKYLLHARSAPGVTSPVTTHRTLAAAKRAGSAAISTHSNPWTPAPAGYLSSSFSPPPSPYGAVNVPAGPLASSYSPPPNPLGWPAYESGTLQGPEAHRSHPDQPLWR